MNTLRSVSGTLVVLCVVLGAVLIPCGYIAADSSSGDTDEDQTITITYSITGKWTGYTYTYTQEAKIGESLTLYPSDISWIAQIALSSYSYWCDESAGTYYELKAENVAFTKDVTLTASSDSPAYSVTYKQSEDSSTQFVTKYMSASDAIVRDNSFTDDTKHFVYWGTESGKTYNPGETVDFGSSKSVTLYGVWSSTTPLIVVADNLLLTKGDAYTLTYTVIGLTDGHTATIDMQIVDENGNIVESADAVGVYTVICMVTDITDKDGSSVMDQYEIHTYSGFMTIRNSGSHSEVVGAAFILQ